MDQDSNSFSETLDSSISLTDLAIADPHQSSSSTNASASSSPSSDPVLSRNASLNSRLNAKAPEFVPRSSSSSPSSSTPRADATQTGLVLTPPQASPPGLLHVYPGPNSAFRLPIHGGPPVQNHHPYSHHVPVQYHHHHHRPQYYGGGFVDHHEVQQQASGEPDHVPALKNGLTEEANQKILNQDLRDTYTSRKLITGVVVSVLETGAHLTLLNVEYYFSDLNLATTDHLMRFINKDAQGYVPISVVASFKKIKALISSNSQLASVLRNSAKLVVSEDGKKVRRQHPLTESDMEELQSRIVVAENLPEDHCHQNLMKIFSAVGSVKSIRTCQPQTSNGGASSASRPGKVDSMLFSNKLHAFVEYESVELAEKAVAELNGEANWRSGLRVRLLLRRAVKSAQARAKKLGHEVDANCEEDDTSTSEQPQLNEKHLEDHSQHNDTQSHENAGVELVNEKDGGQKKGRNRGRGKGRGRGQYHHNNRGSHVGTTHLSNYVNTEQPSAGKQQQQQPPPPGPRMPDGTRGFSMGRGKPVAVNIA